MQLTKINYRNLNSKQKEICNFQKVASHLSEYGFNCIKLADDWQGADFLAYHYEGNDTLRVQLKARLSIAKKYLGKSLHMCFPLQDRWYLVEHDALVEFLSETTTYLTSSSWTDKGSYHTLNPNKETQQWLSKFRL